MPSRSFFEEQELRRRLTWFFLALGAVWMALMGFMVVVGHVEFVNSVGRQLDPRAFRGINPQDAARSGWWGAAIAVAVWALVALGLYLRSNRLIPRLVGAHRANTSEERLLAEKVEEMAIASGTVGPTLRFYVLETSEKNAFACGRSPRDGSIVVTRGLLAGLEEDELHAVLAHELAHLKNGDTAYVVQALGFVWVLMATLLAVVWGAVVAAVIIALVFFLMMKMAETLSQESDDLEGCGGSLFMVFLAIAFAVAAASFLAMYIFLLGTALVLTALGVKSAASSISQAREYLADACAAQWTRNPKALATALAKISSGGALASVQAAAVSPLLIHAPAATSDGQWRWRLYAFLFHSHPPVLERIARLRSMAPLGGEDWDLKVGPEGPRAAISRFAAWLIPLASTAVAVVLVAGYLSLAAQRNTPQTEARAPAAAAPTPRAVFAVVKETSVRLREGPSTGTRTLALLRKGTRVRILNSQGSWYAVAVEGTGQRGWVAQHLVVPERRP